MFEVMDPPPYFVAPIAGALLRDEAFGAYSRWTYPSNMYVFCDEWSVLKSGKRGNRLVTSARKWRLVAQCSQCGVFRRSSPVGVKTRVYRELPAHTVQLFCVGCDNKLRALDKRLIDADRARLFCNSIRRKINEAAKNSS